MSIDAGRVAQLLRFVAVGGGVAALFALLAPILIVAGLPPVYATLLAYFIAFCVGYSGQFLWTFGGRHQHEQVLPRYLAVQTGCFFLSGLLAAFFAEVLRLTPVIMSVAITIIVSAISCLASFTWVFTRSRESGRSDFNKMDATTGDK